MAVDKNKIIAEATKHIQKGALEKALQAYQKILAADPKDVRVLLKIAELHQKKGDVRAAAVAFERVAQSYADQGFFLKSVAVYKQVAKLDPDDVRVNEKLSGLYQQLGLMSDAMSQYQFMATAYEKAGDGAKLADVLERMIELDPDNVASSVKLGELHARGGRPAPAIECFRRAADYLKAHNRVDEHLKVSERLAALSPDDVGLTRELAHGYLAKGDTKRALAKLQLCFKADPKDVETLHLLAQAFQDLGQGAKTLSVYKELARVEEERGRRDAARAAWRKVKELAPHDADADAALGGAPAALAPRPPPPGPPPAARPPPPGPPPGAAARPAPPPLGAAGREAIPKLLSETDVYAKYGLVERALEHLGRVFAIDPSHADALERARELHATAGRDDEAARFGARAVRAFAAAGATDRAAVALARLETLAPGHPELDDLAAVVGGSEEVEIVHGDPEDEVVLQSGVVLEDGADGDALALAAASAPDDDVVEDEEPVTPVAPPPAPPDATSPLRQARGAGPSAPPAGRGESPARLDEKPAPTPTPPPSAPRAVAPAVPARTPAPIALPPPGARASPPPVPVATAVPTPAPPGARVPTAPPRASAERATAAAPPAARVPPPPLTAPGRPPAVRSEADEEPDLDDELEEIAFFVQQGLRDDARDALRNLLAFYPGHARARAKLAELEADRGALASEARGDAGADHDLASDLADLGEVGEVEDEDEFQYSVEDVFSQFKQGVRRTVRPEDSATHYDLGIAYKEMGLLDDALQEFATALEGNDRTREVDCLSMIGVCQLAKGDGAGAIATFRRALASRHLTRDAAPALEYELGAAHELAGDREAALHYFQRVATASPAFRDVARRVAALGGGPGRPPTDERPRAGPGGAPARSGPSQAGPKKNIGYL